MGSPQLKTWSRRNCRKLAVMPNRNFAFQASSKRNAQLLSECSRCQADFSAIATPDKNTPRLLQRHCWYASFSFLVFNCVFYDQHNLETAPLRFKVRIASHARLAVIIEIFHPPSAPWGDYGTASLARCSPRLASKALPRTAESSSA